jgi:hypothetical protein
MPYGPGLLAAFMFVRCATALGHLPEVQREIAGGQLARILGGEDPVDLGPAPGLDRVGPRFIEGERVVSYAAAAVQIAFRGLDPTEPLSLARLACQSSRDGDLGRLLGLVDRLLALAQEQAAAVPELPRVILPTTFAALTLAGTPGAGFPDVAL